MQSRFKATAALPLFFGWPMLVQAAAAPDLSDNIELDPVTVTATRTDAVLSDSIASVSVISRTEIERLQPQDAIDLLAGLPGVSLTNNGGPGKASSIFVRGTESDHLLVLIDGIKVGSATSGGFAIQDLPVEQIERIELVRGPRSSLYGSEAIGGVLQIFTRQGGGREGQPVVSFAIGGGSHDSLRGELGIRGDIGQGGWYAASLSGRDTDGINARPSVAEPDKDGYENFAGSLRAGWHFDNGADLSASYLRADSENEFDGSYQDFSDNRQQAFGADLRFSPLTVWKVSLHAGQSRDEADNYKADTYLSSFETRRSYYAWQNDLQVAATQLLSLGLDYQDDEVDGTTEYAVDSRDNTGGYLQYQGDFGRHELQASLRHDDNEQFGNNDTGAVAWGFHLLPALRLNASYGTAFKAPSFNELYFPGYGNADLSPEKSKSVELGLGGMIAGIDWRLDAYRTELDDLIAYDAATFSPGNVDKAVIHGAELQLSALLAGLRSRAYLSWMDPENRADGANHGNTLPRRAERTARLDLDYDIGRASLGATVNATGKRYDDLANSTELGGYTTLALRFGWQLLPRWRVQASANNVFDKDYETAATYAQEGATYYLGLRYTPDL